MRKNTIALAGAACTLLITNTSQGQVIVTFREVGRDVVATWTGSLSPGNWSSDSVGVGTRSGFSGALLSVMNGQEIEIWSGISGPFPPGWSFYGPNSTSGGTFGFFGGGLYFAGVDDDRAPSSPYRVSLDTLGPYTMTWTASTLQSLGLVGLEDTIVWTSSAGGGNTIIFTTRERMAFTDAYKASAGAAKNALSFSASNVLNLVNNGAHHVPLQMQGSERRAWMTADVARNDRFNTDSTLAEAGAAVDLVGKQLVAGLAVGQSWSEQELLFGGEAELNGQYLYSELSYRASDTPLVFSLSAVHGMWDADVERNYVGVPALQTSRGETDVDSSMVRLRADWVDAAKVLGFGITPKVEYAFTETTTDAYKEVGGSLPASFGNQSDSIHQARYGFTAARNVLQDKGLVRLRLEGVHRFDDGGAISTVSTASGSFNTTAPSAKQNWALYGVDFDYKLNELVTLTSGIQSSTAGQDPTLGSSIGMRVAF